LDSSAALIRLAKEADPGGEYVVGDAASLPLPDASFDLVVAFNSLMDLDDMPASVQEAARVLENGGRFCVCITHPMRDAGR
jgi:ubiquinone/menaquinone biosynthesis C-methylase UbiE